MSTLAEEMLTQELPGIGINSDTADELIIPTVCRAVISPELWDALGREARLVVLLWAGQREDEQLERRFYDRD